MDIQLFRNALQTLQSIDFDQYAAQHHTPEQLIAQQGDGISLAQAIAWLKESISKMDALEDAYIMLLPSWVQVDILRNTTSQLQSYVASNYSVESAKPYILEVIRFGRAITTSASYQNLAAHSELNIEEINTVLASVKKSAYELAEISAQQKALIQAIEASRQTVNITLAEIGQQKDIALSSQQSIQTNLQEVAAHKASIETILDNLKTLSQKAHDNIEAIDEKIFDFEKKYKLIEQDETTSKNILSEAAARKNEVEEMVRLLRDVALGHAFSKRAQDLQSAVQWWGVGYAVGAILLAFYIFSILYWTPATTHNDWVNIIANITKISPAVLALIFVSRQYTKERSIQEEYAFKAAIALTLTPYADELSKTTDADRRKIFMDTLSRIYAPPSIEKDDMLPPAIEKLASEVANKVVDRIPAAKS